MPIDVNNLMLMGLLDLDGDDDEAVGGMELAAAAAAAAGDDVDVNIEDWRG